MEYIWYILAALGAGIGTGLAGLSAATVMVPILIVLCPSFSGETGAYQATAIALASDILGSAVTTTTYAKHKNIDQKRGWIMLACILTMSTVGSYAAWLAGNVVLGSFTLFLTFFIGVRFLIKPDTSRENAVSKGEKLDWKGVAISLFFGLTIGFGTGFVGTGGGMMMLVVFTVFLGMELKTAVGTSTFIAPSEGILHHPEGVDLMPSDIQLSGMEVSLVNAMSCETVLRQYLDTVRRQYTHILLDCQPSLGMLTVNALAAADRLIVPVQAEYLPAKGLEQLLQTVGKVRRQLNPKLLIDGILLTMVDSRTNFAKEISKGELL